MYCVFYVFSFINVAVSFAWEMPLKRIYQPIKLSASNIRFLNTGYFPLKREIRWRRLRKSNKFVEFHASLCTLNGCYCFLKSTFSVLNFVLFQLYTVGLHLPVTRTQGYRTKKVKVLPLLSFSSRQQPHLELLLAQNCITYCVHCCRF